MSVLRQIKGLKTEVCSECHRARFEHAQRIQPALRKYASMGEVLGALATSANDYQEKEQLGWALLTMQRDHAHPYWSAALLVAFYPMLSRLCASLQGEFLSKDDLEQCATEAILEVVHSQTLSGGGLYALLKRRVRRIMLQRVQAAEWHALTPRVDETEHVALDSGGSVVNGLGRGWPEFKKERIEPAPDPHGEAALVSFLLAHVPNSLSGDKLELLIATLVRGERLKAYVGRVYGHLPQPQQDRMYERIKRRHARALNELREVVLTQYSDRQAFEKSLSRALTDGALYVRGASATQGAARAPGDRHENHQATKGPGTGPTRRNV